MTFLVGLPAFHQVVRKRASEFNSESTTLIDRFAGNTATNVIFHYDQHVYLNTGRLMKMSDYDYVVPRHRMPGYPFLLSFFYQDADAYEIDPTGADPRKVSAPYFERAKEFNLWLSTGLIIVLFFFFVRYLPLTESLLITWSITWLIFVFKTPYVQPEVLFFSLSLILVILLWRQIANPTWGRAIITGVVLAATYFVKSALLPLILLFGFCYAAALIRNGLAHRHSGGRFDTPYRRRWLTQLGQGALVPLVGFLLLSPYLNKTRELHGSPFWSVHSAHYYWLEDVGEKKKWKGLAEKAAKGDIPEDAPTAKRYLASHSAGEIINRFVKGAKDTRSKIKKEYPETERFLFRRLGRVCLVVALLFCIPVFQSARKRWPELLFLGGFLIGYALLYGWFNPIRAGLRFMLSLYPIAIALGFWFLARSAGIMKLPRFRIQVHLRPLLLLALAISLGFSIAAVISDLAWCTEGGS